MNNLKAIWNFMPVSTKRKLALLALVFLKILVLAYLLGYLNGAADCACV